MTTERSTEVLSDPTNVLAMESAVRRCKRLRVDSKDATCVRLATTQRVVRAQRRSDAGYFLHFRLLALTTAGRDEVTMATRLSLLVVRLEPGP